MEPWNPRLVDRRTVFAPVPHRDDGGRFTGLWVAGSLDGLARPAVAVVGARACSAGGRERAHALGKALARAGVCVVSGLAKGIDGAAHAGAVDGAGPTVGVLGGGHDCFYPRENAALARRMVAAGGAVISPFAPVHPALRHQFTQRNEIVAALADAIVVVEARESSGALITADYAGQIGRDVFAFPGDVDRSTAAGCNKLIREGATLVRDANDVLEGIGIVPPADGGAAQTALGEDETAIVRALRDAPLDLDELVAATGLAPGVLLALLVRLDIDGVVRRREDATFALPQRQTR